MRDAITRNLRSGPNGRVGVEDIDWMSRLMMPSVWAASCASAMSMAMATMRSTSNIFAAIRYFSVTPSKYSMAMKGSPFVLADLIDCADIRVV